MRKVGLFLVCALAALVGWQALPGARADSAAVAPSLKLGSASWMSDLAAAQQQSKLSGKPILWLDMVGRLDEKWC